MSCGGLNQFLTADVPAGNGDGALLDVSGLVADKTLYLAGSFIGSYVILGSHDDTNFVPIASFNGGEGPQTIRRDLRLTLKSIKVRRNANKQVTVNIAGQATCSC